MADRARVEEIREYERTLTEVAENQVVDAAEDVISRVWVAELDAMRREGLRLAMAVRIADRVAREEVQRAQVGGRPAELARAHARLVETSAEAAESLGHANALLTSVDAELTAVCAAGVERGRRGERNLDRLRAAWTAAYGQP
ncbi:MAG TPA: hypothetical protein VL551_29795 [Actinospica sp.]|jgi:hypothetical protein|nr:hypothetical protein [Actinospica sp.]